MKSAKLSDIVGIINKLYPPGFAESWDNPGLQVGDPKAEISRIMVALDASPVSIEAAISSGCQLLITHHPLIFKPQPKISNGTPLGAMIYTAIRHGLSVVSMHTNYDIADGGLNDALSEVLGINDCVPLQVTSEQQLVKLVVFVPEDHLDKVRNSLFEYAEILGAYRDCSFSASGIGTFTPLEGASPFIGKVGTSESVSEYRLEMLLSRDVLPRAVKTMLSSHPYEEPAFDIYPLLNQGSRFGLGRIGRLASPLPLSGFAGHVRGCLNAGGVRYVGDPSTIVQKVAVCSGSGASLISEAARAGADVLVTGDVRFHDARDAESQGLALVDAGHFSTEIIMVNSVVGRLTPLLAKSGFLGCEILPCQAEADPFIYSSSN